MHPSASFSGLTRLSTGRSPSSCGKSRRKTACLRCELRGSSRQAPGLKVHWPREGCRAWREIRWWNAWEYPSQYQKSALRWKRGSRCSANKSSSSSSGAFHCELWKLWRRDLQSELKIFNSWVFEGRLRGLSYSCRVILVWEYVQCRWKRLSNNWGVEVTGLEKYSFL